MPIDLKAWKLAAAPGGTLLKRTHQSFKTTSSRDIESQPAASLAATQASGFQQEEPETLDDSDNATGALRSSFPGFSRSFDGAMILHYNVLRTCKNQASAMFARGKGPLALYPSTVSGVRQHAVCEPHVACSYAAVKTVKVPNPNAVEQQAPRDGPVQGLWSPQKGGPAACRSQKRFQGQMPKRQMTQWSCWGRLWPQPSIPSPGSFEKLRCSSLKSFWQVR